VFNECPKYVSEVKIRNIINILKCSRNVPEVFLWTCPGNVLGMIFGTCSESVHRVSYVCFEGTNVKYYKYMKVFQICPQSVLVDLSWECPRVHVQRVFIECPMYISV
jgi:hypothetical protein